MICLPQLEVLPLLSSAFMSPIPPLHFYSSPPPPPKCPYSFFFQLYQKAVKQVNKMNSARLFNGMEVVLVTGNFGSKMGCGPCFSLTGWGSGWVLLVVAIQTISHCRSCSLLSFTRSSSHQLWFLCTALPLRSFLFFLSLDCD